MLREKIMFIDELTPEDGVVISGKGNADAVYRKIPEVVSSIMEIPKREVLEKKHEVKEGYIASTWEFFKALDDYSYYHFELSFRGDKEGNVKISFWGKLKTELLRENLWQKSVLYEFLRTIWYEYIYSKGKRKKFLEEGRELARLLAENLKALLR